MVVIGIKVMLIMVLYFLSWLRKKSFSTVDITLWIYSPEGKQFYTAVFVLYAYGFSECKLGGAMRYELMYVLQNVSCCELQLETEKKIAMQFQFSFYTLWNFVIVFQVASMQNIPRDPSECVMCKCVCAFASNQREERILPMRVCDVICEKSWYDCVVNESITWSLVTDYINKGMLCHLFVVPFSY